MYSVGLSVSFLAFHLHPPTVGQIEKNCLRKEINSSLFSNKTVGRNGLFKIRSKNKLIHQKIYHTVPFGGIQTKTKISFYSWSLIYLNLLRDNFNYVLFSGVIKLTFDWFSGCLLSIHWDRGHHLRIDITRQVYNQFQTIGPLIKGAGGECKVPLLPPLRNHSCREYNFFGRTRNFWLTMKPQIESIRSTQYGWCG